MTRPRITSISNSRLKALRRLRTRRPNGLVLVEGFRQLARALEADVRVREVYACPELYLGESEPSLVSHAEQRGAAVFELGAAAFSSIAGRSRPDGLAALVERPVTPLATLAVGRDTLLLVAQSVERPGNLGTIVRTAAGAGISGLLVCDPQADVFHPEVVRASVGTLFGLHVAETTTLVAISWLRAHGVRIVVASPTGRDAYWEADFGPPAAVVVGSERHGVAREWLNAADAIVRIPMTEAVDSLNVAVAAGIVLFEARRQVARYEPEAGELSRAGRS